MVKAPTTGGGPPGGEPARRPWLLLIDDEPQARGARAAALGARYSVASADSFEATMHALECHPYQVVVCGGAAWLERGGDLPELLAARVGEVALVTSSAPLRAAARLFGNHSVELPPLALGGGELQGAVERAVAQRQALFDAELWRHAYGRDTRGSLFIGATPAMRAVFAAAEQVAQTAAPLFITGESGSGKEFLARYVHLKSARHDRPFHAVNCAAFTDSMMVSEVFGHARGAFTGAGAEHKGCIELADRSTLLFDEIAELRSDLQSRLLRVVESRSITRLGAERSIPIDVRFIAAAQKPPEDLIREGRLRDDLYYRLGVVTLSIPPLRERLGDLEVLGNFLLGQFQRELDKPLGPLSAEALALLRAHTWPGNVREFRNVIERAAIFAPAGEPIRAAHLPPELKGRGGGRPFVVPGGEQLPLDEVVQRYTRHVLEQCGGNRARAAKVLGVAPSTLWRWGKDSLPH